MTPRHAPPCALTAAHRVDTFACGNAALDHFIQRFALASQNAHGARTYVCSQSNVVTGYYTLAVGSVEPASSTTRVRKGLARHPIPVMVLARLAVDRAHQGKGLGQALLKDALLRTSQAADIAGIRAVLVHAKDDGARRWYETFGFEPSPTDPHHLFLLLKDLRAALPR